MPIAFSQIPDSLRRGGLFLEFDSSRAGGSSATIQRVLVIAPKLSGGSLSTESPQRVMSDTDADVLCGVGSIGAQMIRAARQISTVPELWALAPTDPESGTAPSVAVTVTIDPAYATDGPPAGTIPLMVCGTRIPVSFARGATVAQIATAITTAVNSRPALPVTAAAAEGVVTLTSRHTLALAAFDVRAAYYDGERLPIGISLAIASTPGAGDIDHAAVISALDDRDYFAVALPDSQASTLADWKEEMTRRANAMVAQDGLAFAAPSGTVAQMAAVGAGSDGNGGPNSERICLVPEGLKPTPAWTLSAAVAALVASQNDPARPMRSLALTGILGDKAPPNGEDREQLLWSGVSSLVVSDSGDVTVERLITTYRRNALGAPDTAYLDVTTVATLAYLRRAVINRFALRYPRHKLAADGTRIGAGQPVMTPALARVEILGLFGEWELAGLVQGREQFEAELIVEINASDPNRLDTNLSPQLIGQFLTGAFLLSFRL